MKGLLVILSAVGILTGCEPSASNSQDKFPMPKGFEDYEVGRSFDGSTSIYMVRCSQSDTSVNYREG